MLDSEVIATSILQLAGRLVRLRELTQRRKRTKDITRKELVPLFNETLNSPPYNADLRDESEQLRLWLDIKYPDPRSNQLSDEFIARYATDNLNLNLYRVPIKNKGVTLVSVSELNSSKYPIALMLQRYRSSLVSEMLDEFCGVVIEPNNVILDFEREALGELTLNLKLNPLLLLKEIQLSLSGDELRRLIGSCSNAGAYGTTLLVRVHNYGYANCFELIKGYMERGD